MKSFAVKLLLSALFSLAAELMVACYTKALVGGAILPAAGLSFLLPFASFAGCSWFVEERNGWRRLWLVAAGALGYAVGTVAVMLCWQ